MKTDLLEKLLDAGFTKEEIFRLARDEPQATPEPEKTSEPEPEPEPETEPEAIPEPVNTPVPEETENRLANIEKNISDLVKAIQLQNLKNDSFNGNTDSLEDQTDKIMQSIIRPEVARKDGNK